MIWHTFINFQKPKFGQTSAGLSVQDGTENQKGEYGYEKFQSATTKKAMISQSL